MNLKKGIMTGIAFSTLAVVLAACGQSNSSESPAKTGTWTRMVNDVLTSMDPSTTTDIISGQQVVDTMEGLYRYKGKTLANGLATRMVVSPDGKTYTFTLRHSKWSDGTALTAKDFVYAWRRTVDPKTKSEYAYLYSGIRNADAIMAGKKAKNTLGIRAEGDYKLVVTLDQPIPYFQKMLVNPAFFPQSEKMVAKAGKKYGTNAKDVLTNGPYTLQSWNGTGNTWSETKNKNYWNAKNVHIKTIKTQVVKDSATAKNLYGQGKLDDAILSGQTAASAKTNKDYQAQREMATFYLVPNVAKVPALKNTKIRQALSLALNRPEYVNKVLNDGSIAADSIMPKGIATDPASGNDFATTANKATKQYTAHNVKEAKKLFAQGLKETGKKSLSIELLSDDTTQGKQSAEYLQNALQDVGNLR